MQHLIHLIQCGTNIDLIVLLIELDNDVDSYWSYHHRILINTFGVIRMECVNNFINERNSKYLLFIESETINSFFISE